MRSTSNRLLKPFWDIHHVEELSKRKTRWKSEQLSTWVVEHLPGCLGALESQEDAAYRVAGAELPASEQSKSSCLGKAKEFLWRQRIEGESCQQSVELVRTASRPHPSTSMKWISSPTLTAQPPIDLIQIHKVHDLVYPLRGNKIVLKSKTTNLVEMASLRQGTDILIQGLGKVETVHYSHKDSKLLRKWNNSPGIPFIDQWWKYCNWRADGVTAKYQSTGTAICRRRSLQPQRNWNPRGPCCQFTRTTVSVIGLTFFDSGIL